MKRPFRRARAWFWGRMWALTQWAHDQTGILRDRAYDAHNRANNLLYYGKPKR